MNDAARSRAAAPASTVAPASTAAPRSPAWRLLATTLLVTLVAAVYAQTADFGFLEWDDDVYVRDNPRVTSGLTRESAAWALTTFRNANWHPLTWWSLQLDVSLFGTGPRAPHLVNGALHALNTVLVFALLTRFGLGAPRALAAAAVFAVHPLHVESVAWIAERKDVLCAGLALASLIAWDGWVRRGGHRRYACALALFALALMAKPMAVTLPLLLLVLDAWPYARLRAGGLTAHAPGAVPRVPHAALRASDAAPRDPVLRDPVLRDPVLRARLLEKLPFMLLAGASAVVTYAAQSAGGAVRPIEAVGLADRLGNALVAYAMYLAGTVLPRDQSFLYPFVPPAVAAVAASAAVLAVGAAWAWRRGGAARAGALWFVIALLPVIGLVTIGEHARADRYMYLPMVGLLMLAASLLPAPEGAGRRTRALVAAGAAAAVLALGLAAHRYAGLWRDSLTLFSHALAVDPRNHAAHTLLAATHARGGDARAVYAHAEAALRLAPATIAAASAAISASNVAMAGGDAALARRYLERAIAAAPRFARPHYNLGTLHLQLGDAAGSVAHFERALALAPGYSEAWNNLGAALRQLGRNEQATGAFAEALRADPDNAAARTNLARARGGRP